MKRWLPHILLLIGILMVVAAMRPPKKTDAFNRAEFARLPVLVGGRVKPMDTLARTSLLAISGKQVLRHEKKKISAIDWLIETMMRPERADQFPVFAITNPDLRELFGFREESKKTFSFNDLRADLGKVEEQSISASRLEAPQRNPYQREVLKLRERVLLYLRLKNTLQMEDSPDFGRELADFKNILAPGLAAMDAEKAGTALTDEQRDAFNKLLDFARRHQRLAQAAYVSAIPKTPADASAHDWKHIGPALATVIAGGAIDPAIQHYGDMISAYRADDAAKFNTALSAQTTHFATYKAATSKIGFETFFNQLQPFYLSMTLYVLIFILAFASWLVWPQEIGRGAFWLLGLAFAIHTFGLLARMYLQGRPPVTNLYSSAVFVGWGSVLLCVILEKINRNSIASVVAAAIGFVTLLIAHHLSIDGDTMEMLRAVLDTNIWLATHVVVITLGYSATFLAGFLGIVFIVRGLFTRSLTRPMAKSIGVMVYGIICFATLFSFVGTILGGIWADQSWGRFWGWDAKENGALLIVIWNALILHARWGGMIRERGLMILSIGGNIVTAFSWFGVNMLGVGLHSYGFMDEAFIWIIAFDISQLIIIALALIPMKHWRSFSEKPTPPAALEPQPSA
ncbi:MAG TPA: cytochrome c biogenesis protein CcsA [Chthoniobacterales bacterium]|jgi:ABC-type transport system involved in cytochrome c biogenesis permease subunit